MQHIYATVSLKANKIQASHPNRHQLVLFALSLLGIAQEPEDIYILIAENLGEGDYKTLQKDPKWAEVVIEAQKTRGENEAPLIEQGRVSFFPAKNLNPHNQDWTKIPMGNIATRDVNASRRSQRPMKMADPSITPPSAPSSPPKTLVGSTSPGAPTSKRVASTEQSRATKL